MKADLREIARAAVGLAQRAGAQQAAAGAYRSRQVDVEWRDGRIENVSDATTRGLGLELYVDGRYSAVSTSDLRSTRIAVTFRVGSFDERMYESTAGFSPLTTITPSVCFVNVAPPLDFDSLGSSGFHVTSVVFERPASHAA